MKDAHRQTAFLLADDLALFERAMTAQLKIVAHNSRAKTPAAAGLLTLWSRTFSLLSDACAAITIASYSSATPLLRATLDFVAAQKALVADGFSEYEDWYAHAVSKQGTALAIDLGRFRGASLLTEDERLGNLYRLLSDLSMPHFGPALLITAPDSGELKIAAGFADHTFHLAWAEISLGWSLEIAFAQLETVAATDAISLPDDLSSECKTIGADTRSYLQSARRCYVEPQGERFVFHNFRRTATGQPRRIIL